MLYEIQKVKQDPDGYHKRWFTDEYFDLFLWYDAQGKIAAFQLAYDKSHNERAITWKRKGGFMHTRVDDGEATADSTMSPILVSDGLFDNKSVADRFRESAAHIDASVTDFVYRKLLQFPPERNY
jgi:hypothetical protein